MEHTAHTHALSGRTASDRSFGVVFTIVFLIVALWPLPGGGPARLWALAIAAAFALISLLRPRLLAPLNRAWTRLGLTLHKVVNPIVLGLIFAITIVPTGLVFRLLRKDPLRLRRDPALDSYWIRRDPPGPEPKSMQRQF